MALVLQRPQVPRLRKDKLMDLRQDWGYINRVADRRRSQNQTPWHIDVAYLEVIGAAGELAARRFLGLPEKLHEHFDQGVDFKWRGYTVDVKATKLTPLAGHRYLQWPIGKNIKADIILMVAVSEAERMAVPLGFVFADEVEFAPINHDRKQACHEIPVPELRPSWELFTLPPRNQSAARTQKSCVLQ